MFWDKPVKKKQKAGDQAPVRNPGTGFFFWKADKETDNSDSPKKDQDQQAIRSESSPKNDTGGKDD